jgi:hypothetical protein
MSKLLSLIGYVKDRLNERSTWLFIGTGITAASALPAPWNYYSLAVATIAAFVPDGTVK